MAQPVGVLKSRGINLAGAAANYEKDPVSRGYVAGEWQLIRM